MADKLVVTKETPPGDIERDIASTRKEIGGTLNEIKERFSLNHFKEEAKDKIREKADRFISSVRTMSLAAQQSVMNAKNRGQQIIHDNPVAVGMAALGVGALMLLVIVLKRRGKSKKMSRGSRLPLLKEAERKTIGKVRQARETGLQEEEFKKAA